MLSYFHKKIVFIDFGLSKVVNEDLGFKTLTSYHGTPKYVSAEMLKLFSIDAKEDYVDLYYNDLVGLKRVAAELILNSKQIA